MSQLNQQLYVEETYGADIAALVQVLEVLGISVIKSLPPPKESCYVLVDIQRRRERCNNRFYAWYETRAELDVRGVFIGLAGDGDDAPIPGAYQIKAEHALLGVLEALAQTPRAISAESLQHQRLSSQQRQTNQLIHDLTAVSEWSNLSPETTREMLTTTSNLVTNQNLKSILENLIDEVIKAPPEQTRDILKRQLTTLENG